jgi:DnaJ-class molecular chaperone
MTACERCEGTGDLYGRARGPIAICPDCGGHGRVTDPDEETR